MISSDSGFNLKRKRVENDNGSGEIKISAMMTLVAGNCIGHPVKPGIDKAGDLERSLVFNKTGKTGGRITVKENGKVLCDEPLTQTVQPQKGFLY